MEKERRPGDSLRGLLVVLCYLICITTLAANGKPASSHGRHTEAIGNRTSNRLQLEIGINGRAHIPGLYDAQDGIITPIQGQNHFNQLVLGLDTDNESNSVDCSSDVIREAGASQTISLVQFYMATCPDCQGFSPYFKRFAQDIGPHWRRLVRIYTVNCNDFQNIHLCQEQNPKLIVPMVRWYQLPIIQRDARLDHCKFDMRPEMLSVAHRQFIDEQRRDLISLRRATLRFATLMVDELSTAVSNETGAMKLLPPSGSRKKLFESLPIHWRQLDQLKEEAEVVDVKMERQFFGEIKKRTERCRTSMDRDKESVENFLIFEGFRSFIGRTLVADWSKYACARNQSGKAVLVHRTSNADLLRHVTSINAAETYELNDPILFHLDESSGRPKLVLLASNGTEGTNRLKRNASNQPNRLERIYQRASLERFYSHPRASVDKQPVRYAAAMAAASARRKHLTRKREAQDSEGSTSKHRRTLGASRATHQATYENANWTPEEAYPGEERLRFKFNRLIAAKLNLAHDSWPGALLNGHNPAKIERSPSVSNVTRVDPVEDDLTLMFLTDYYKGLDEIVHIDMLAKAEVDGLQLLASCNFLHDLKHHFPYQGNALGSTRIGSKSIARYYIELLHDAWTTELNKHLANNRSNHSGGSFGGNHQSNRENGLSSKALDRIRVSSRRLEHIQSNLRLNFDVGLPSERHLKWFYCAGSSDYLRGHTCSLWVLFHTLTVHEYLKTTEGESETQLALRNKTMSPDSLEYRFQVDYSKPPKRACNPANPDEAFLSARTRDLYVNSTSNFVLANIINFVRFYLPCTNCAAHFSCMVDHSPGLHSFYNRDDEDAASQHRPDSHLLWLWEGHNRVNERTRGTHSEDPMRPKHIFPQFGACPKCYLEQPKANASFTSMRFNRPELVKFVVARYRKSAILNNKINIEDLYRKTP